MLALPLGIHFVGVEIEQPNVVQHVRKIATKCPCCFGKIEALLLNPQHRIA